MLMIVHFFCSKFEIVRRCTLLIFPLFSLSVVTSQTLFELLDEQDSGIDFRNNIVDTKDHNILLYANYYGGAGVGIGDFNNDGLQDLYFTGNLVSDELYINKGNLAFEKITKRAGIIDDGTWSSSVTLADVNADGYLDIYVTKELYDFQPEKRKNKLYINNGDLTFREEAEKWGIADNQRSRGAVFLDYDKDGFLDLFVLNQPPNPGSYSPFFGTDLKQPEYTSRLYRNNQNLFFEDVTVESGVHRTGFPNAVVASDLNHDGWTDLYVANDFDAPDFLYINNKNGGFSYQTEQQLKHISFFSMGVDATDLNNDLLTDVMVLDMVAEDNYRLKANMSAMDVDTFWDVYNSGGHFQYMFNTLQLNNGNNSFSDVAQLTNMAATDWSWSNLIADFDNDGYKDVFVTNGLLRDIRNTDADEKIGEYVLEFADNYVSENPDQGDIQIMDILDLDEVLSILPSVPLSNYMFQNNSDLRFTNVSKEWGLDIPTFSNGAAYGDLDNDGDLEIVINNVNERAYIYKNNTSEESDNNHLRIQLSTEKPSFSQNTRIVAYHGSTSQVVEATTFKGMYSTSEAVLHFGLGLSDKIDSLQITWPLSTAKTLKNLDVNQLLVLQPDDGTKTTFTEKVPNTLFKDVTHENGLNLEHKENVFDDFQKQVLLPHKLSQFGPALATGDINGDGLDDFYFGGASGQTGELMVQQSDGSFEAISNGPWEKHRVLEDIDAIFFDANNDGHLDLMVLSGGNEFAPGTSAYLDRLYIGLGDGTFEFSREALPEIFESGGTVKPFDFDQDGDTDLFVGNAFKPWNYPESPRSYILENQSGIFEIHDESQKLFSKLGMISDAVVVDYDEDGFEDLVIVGHWTPIVFVQNVDGVFRIDKERTRNDLLGWWFSIEKGDIDNDGDTDFVLGNLGTNYKYKASSSEPFELYYNDFDQNGNKDIVLTYYNYGIQYPLRGFSCSTTQVPILKKKIGSYDLFASMNVSEVYGDNMLAEALHLQATTFSSGILRNQSNKNYEFEVLPIQAQFSSINDISIHDYTSDGIMDILIVGNLFVSEIETPRNDASIGLLLAGVDEGKYFQPVSVVESGFMAPYDAKKLKTLGTSDGFRLLVGNNDGILQQFEIQK